MVKPIKPLVVPEFGVIKGGKLNGWRYKFLYFVARPDRLLVMARVSAPNWPFPHDMELRFEHFAQLRAVVGERAPRLQAEALIKSAFAVDGIPCPDWTAERRTTLRQRTRPRAKHRGS